MLAPKSGTIKDGGQAVIAAFYRLSGLSWYEAALRTLLESQEIVIRGINRASKGGVLGLFYRDPETGIYHWGQDSTVEEFTRQWLEDCVAMEFETVSQVHLTPNHVVARAKEGGGPR